MKPKINIEQQIDNKEAEMNKAFDDAQVFQNEGRHLLAEACLQTGWRLHQQLAVLIAKVKS